MYHHISREPAAWGPYVVSEAELESDLRWLREHRDEFTPAERCKMRLGSSTITGIWLGGYVGR